MKYVPPLSLQREVYSKGRAKNVDHPEILTDLYLARLANEFDVPMILTSQVSRGAIRRGALDVHAAASGNMERAASTVLVIAPASETDIEITCHKDRWGQKGGKVTLTAAWSALKFTP